MRVKDILYESTDLPGLQRFLQLLSRCPASVRLQALVWEDESKLAGVYFLVGPFKPAADLLQVNIFQELEIPGVAEEQTHLARAPVDHFSWVAGAERGERVTVEEECDSSLSGNDRIHEIVSRVT